MSKVIGIDIGGTKTSIGLVDIKLGKILKKIIVPRSMTIFLLFAIVLYFGFLLIYTFKAMFISGILYLIFIPISLLHYFKINKKKLVLYIKKDIYYRKWLYGFM